MYTIEDLLEKTEEEINRIVAHVVMDWYWGEGLGCKAWIEGPLPESAEFVWGERVMSGFDEDWNPVDDFKYGEFVLDRMNSEYGVSDVDIRNRSRILDGITTGKAVCIIAILEAQKK